MKKHINKILTASQKIKKEWVLCFLLAVGFIVACQGALEEGNPFGPSNSKIVIVQSSPQVNKGGTQNFTAIGGTLPLSWSLSATQIGAIAAATGVFTSNQAAPQVAGTATVTVVDAVGDTDTATITVLPNLLVITPGSSTQLGTALAEEFTVADTDTATITVLPNALAIAPGSSTQFAAGNEEFTVTGGSGAVVATIVNNDSVSTFNLPTLLFPANVVTVAFTQPTKAQGNQTFTISITDAENGDTGSVVLTLVAALT